VGKNVICRMDVHKKFCQVIICTKEGEVIKEGKIRINEEEIKKFFYGIKRSKSIYRSIYKL